MFILILSGYIFIKEGAIISLIKAIASLYSFSAFIIFFSSSFSFKVLLSFCF